MSEVKPILKPSQVDIPTRIANQQKWLDEDIALKAISRENAKPIQDKLNQIKQKYNRLQSAGALTAKDSKELNQMLDQCSESVFRLTQKVQKGFNY